eukprot:GFYU01002885.1.p1 GENE.GFYU01002885.1~~GFYU01002885.1.p1  ORF type:complete len:408 (+),score=114.00 GFYU01002885.1:65-1225(+)
MTNTAAFQPKVKAELRPEEREALNIDRRRQLEAERYGRIMDPKTRSLGVDKTALDEQVKLRNAREQLEKDRELLLDEQMKLAEQGMEYLENMRREARAQVAKEIDNYRRMHQTKDSRKEFDLSDPNGLRNEQPPRVDNEGDVAVSSIQKFEGEDATAKDRNAQQAAQQAGWVRQQLAEKREREQRELDDDTIYAATVEEMTYIKAQMENASAEARRAMNKATHDYNTSLHNERIERRQQDKMEEVNANLEEIKNQLESDLLNEDVTTTVNAFNDSRWLPYGFKGFTSQQTQHIRETQVYQISEREHIKQQENEEERLWQKQADVHRKVALLQERQQERAAQAKAKAHREALLQQMEDAKQRKKQVDNTYANQVHDSFFSQFGTSTR